MEGLCGDVMMWGDGWRGLCGDVMMWGDGWRGYVVM